MKLACLLCAMLLGTLIAHAQPKPSKEETLAFMNRTMAAAYGIVYATEYGQDSQVESSSLSYTAYQQTIVRTKVSSEFRYTVARRYPTINWKQLKDTTPATVSTTDGNEVIEFAVYFSSKLNCSKLFTTANGGENTTEEEDDILHFVIPKNRLASFQKACLRLAEIAKAEDEDPFQK